MISIQNIDQNKFSLDGIPYYKNFIPHVEGNMLRIVNSYDSKLVLCEFAKFDEFEIDGLTYPSISDLQMAILPILFYRGTLGESVIENWTEIGNDIENNNSGLVRVKKGLKVKTGDINNVGITITNEENQISNILEVKRKTGLTEVLASWIDKIGAIHSAEPIYVEYLSNPLLFTSSRIRLRDIGTEIIRDKIGSGVPLTVKDINVAGTGDSFVVSANISGVQTDILRLKRNGTLMISPAIDQTDAVTLSQISGETTTKDFQYPSDFTFRPFKITEISGKFSVDKSNYDIVKHKIPNMKPYYVNYVSGSNSNNGLTESLAFKTIPYALSQGAQLIYLADKDVIQTDGWGALINNSTYGNKDVFVISKGRTFVVNSVQSLSYSLDTGSTYVANIGANTVPNVIDFNFLNEYGFPVALVKQTSVANVNSTANSYYITGTSLYVHLNDGRVPDGQIHALKISADNRFMSDASEYFYGEGISFLGGNNAFTIRGASGGHLNGLLNRCNFAYAKLNGLGTQQTDGLIWSENCISFDNGRDGFNYTQPSGYNDQKAIEVNCIGFNNGTHTDDTTSAINGSSAHNRITVLRVEGKYFGNRGPNVIDVNGAKSLNVGVECFNSIGFNDAPLDPSSPGVNWPDWGDFGVGTIATESATKMWCYGCKSKDTRLSFGTPIFLTDGVTADTSVIYVDKSSNVSAFLNNVVSAVFTAGNSAKYDFPALSTFTAATDKQDLLVSATNIKTVNGNNLLGAGNLTVGDIITVVKDTVISSTLTGTLTETILKTYSIPANTFSASDILNLSSFRIVKAGVAGTVSMRVYINTVASLSGAVQIAQYNTAASNLTAKITRSFCLTGGNLTGVIFNSTTLLSDVAISNATISSTPLNPANNFYIITTAQLSNAGDSVYQNELRITN